MKSKLFLSAILTCFLAFTSCSDDDSDSEVVAELRGEWSVEGVSHEEFGYESWEGDEVVFEFKEGGVFTTSSPDGSESGTYSANSDNVIITLDGETVTFSIDKLTSSDLELTGDLEFEIEDGVFETFTVTYYLTR